ncbi:MAG: bifunctional diaminohydroxyphosphoribosylaminopyrimidine deaminase/5-amino-6-(5-phosphoribosylamino)uracil reductase RibD [Pseudomonadales bacterium]|nr:bifunctional diaminohydroxyphosphoribosylaminopyrimidine deaminase/5-amino-6-(5-phosphoribosylamino)uracil reductase RibD [Pseudomonadales bacterium]
MNEQFSNRETSSMDATAVACMRRAVALARSVFSATPNPRVGCVIIRAGQTVGEGWHTRPGTAHAEVNALQQAGDLAKGASVYVTLEPCCHFGKTPPCTDALIAAGVAEVYLGMLDPNPLVAGQGAERLRQAGIRVYGPLLEQECAALNPGFSKRMRLGMPFVRCKMAMSLDGRTAMASGESQWITGPASRADVQRLRAGACAMVTGVNTVLSDNPGLNVRAEQLKPDDAEQDIDELVHRQPRRVIIDSGLRTPPESKIVTLDGDVLFLVGTPHPQQYERFAGSHAEIRQIPTLAGGRLDLQAAMHCLATEFACNEVMLEAGPTLSGAMLQAGLVDEIVVYIGARLLGSDALPLFALPGLRHMADHIGLKISEVKSIADDCRITAQVINQ